MANENDDHGYETFGANIIAQADAATRREFERTVNSDLAPQPRSSPLGYSAAELVQKFFAPIVWIIEGMLTIGLTILAGRPKIGKSWLVLQLLTAIAAGSAVLSSTSVMQSTVLYYSLEDGYRRLRNRILKQLPGGTVAPPRLHFRCALSRLDEGCLDMIENELRGMVNCRVVVIDCFARIRPRKKVKESTNQYDLDSDKVFKPILIVAYDTGMRLDEVLGLRWAKVDLATKVIRLGPEDTKTKAGREVMLTERAKVELEALPRSIKGFVFVNPKTGDRWVDIRKQFHKACEDAGITGVWFHDLRRSFVTNARRRGVAESVVMKLSGHRTSGVFKRYNIIDSGDLRSAVAVIEAGSAAELASGREEALKVAR